MMDWITWMIWICWGSPSHSSKPSRTAKIVGMCLPAFKIGSRMMDDPLAQHIERSINDPRVSLQKGSGWCNWLTERMNSRPQRLLLP
ncbi:hypothetical protein CPB83DRAFT_857489 [Crepidotus variabilis]|uniref:Secreted protein n=1 Tax=Crepidotus variabilis TaxID=179855 RepID=A0A9P6EBX9_9AGAR|nr:hypothetical protein CPB83DRAFT_857489 [Crepidotus variabilis]